MKILQINITKDIGSTGKIVKDIDELITSYGFESYILCGYQLYSEKNTHCLFPKFLSYQTKKNILISRITGMMGYRNWIRTYRALRWIENIKPDVVHMHNIHGDWINVPILINYLKNNNIPIIFTMHDCWGFTGRCSHFENINCFKWKTGCYDCENLDIYPISYFFDFSKQLWIHKRKLFNKLNIVKIVTPSKWLATYVSKSFLNKYDIDIINNGINLKNFKTNTFSEEYAKNEQKKIILGVASTWTKYKGLNDFYNLNKLIDHNKYQIMLVGLNKTQLKSAPKDIIALGRTNNMDELIEIYSNAFVFINMTYLDNYPTVNLESIACGTPVITYDTGGSGESINNNVGRIVDQGDLKGILKAIDELSLIPENKIKCNCIEHAIRYYDKNDKYREYYNLYKEILL